MLKLKVTNRTHQLVEALVSHSHPSIQSSDMELIGGRTNGASHIFLAIGGLGTIGVIMMLSNVAYDDPTDSGYATISSTMPTHDEL